MRNRRDYLWALVALLAGTSLRVFFILRHAHVEGDSLVYGDLATNILRHHIYGFTEGARIRPTLIRLPGYPALMALCFGLFGVGKYASVMWLQLVMDLASCCVLAQLAGRLMGRRAGFCALWLGMLCPFTANYVAAPLTEIPAVFCGAIALAALERWWAARRSGGGLGWACVEGGALSFAILQRPDRALLAVAILGAMAYLATRSDGLQVRTALGQVAVVCLLILLPLMGWAARNWHVFHVVQPLAPRSANDPGEESPVGFQRWYRSWAIDFKSTVDVYWTYDGATIYLQDLPDRTFDSPAQKTETSALIARYNDVLTPTRAMDEEFGRIAAERSRAHPVRTYVVLPLARLLNMWLRPRVEMLPNPLDWWNFSHHRWASVKSVAYAGINLAYLALAAVGLWHWRRAGWSGCRPLGYAMVAYVLMRSALLATMDNSEPRYTIDCFPVVILLAGFGLASLLKRREAETTPAT